MLDLGTHLAYLALKLFGRPESVSAEVVRERDGEGSNDSFTVRLGYPGLAVGAGGESTVGAGSAAVSSCQGTKGNATGRRGIDPQEAAHLSKITRITDGPWGEEPPANWGTRAANIDGNLVTCPVAPIPGGFLPASSMPGSGDRDAWPGTSASHCG